MEERPQYPLLGLLQTQLLVAAEYARRKACAAVLEDNHPITNYNERSGCQAMVHTVLEPSPFRDENDPGLSFGFVAVPRAPARAAALLRAAVHGRWLLCPQDPGSRKKGSA